MAASLSDLLRKMLEMSGSDLHITTNSPPQVRVHGHLQPLDMPVLTPAVATNKVRRKRPIALGFGMGVIRRD